jgi:cytosine/uracil/thiamine/allantoin permease
MIRALVACGWFGVQTMFGGMTINLLINSHLQGRHDSYPKRRGLARVPGTCLAPGSMSPSVMTTS